ncbi:MAG: radical SAM protein [bacterium]|nr:radical SAM protein [bacterium]
MKTRQAAYKFTKNLVNAVRRIPAVMLANILVSTKCTQKCLQCSIPESRTDNGFMTSETFCSIIDKLEKHGTQFISISGGEPLLNKELETMLWYAAGRNFLHVQLLTNFYAPEKTIRKIVDAVIETGAGIQISFDGFGETADRLRGAKDVSEVVMKGIEILDIQNKKASRPVRTSVNVVANAMNLGQVPKILDFVERIGWKANVDLYRWSSSNHNEIEDMKLRDTTELRDLIGYIKRSECVTTPVPIIDGYIDYINDEYEKRCPYLDSTSLGSKFYIGPSGEVEACLGGPVGNIIEQSPEEVFSSAEWNECLKKMEDCRGCWNTCYTPSAITFHPKGVKDLKAVWGILRSR